MKKGLILLIVFSILLSLSACSPYKNSDVSKYGEFRDYSKYSSGSSDYIVFPESIPESAENVKYYFSHVEELLDPAIQLYLEYELSKEDYDAEVQRLKDIKGYHAETNAYTNEKKPIKYDDKNYIFPAYVSIDAYDFSFEYVLMDEGQNRLIYIYTHHISSESQIKFDTSYLRKDWENLQVLEPADSYDIYGYNPLEDE